MLLKVSCCVLFNRSKKWHEVDELAALEQVSLPEGRRHARGVTCVLIYRTFVRSPVGHSNTTSFTSQQFHHGHRDSVITRALVTLLPSAVINIMSAFPCLSNGPDRPDLWIFKRPCRLYQTNLIQSCLLHVSRCPDAGMQETAIFAAYIPILASLITYMHPKLRSGLRRVCLLWFWPLSPVWTWVALCMRKLPIVLKPRDGKRETL